MKIMRIFVKFPHTDKLVELHNSNNYIFDKPCYDWVNNNKIENFLFIDVTHEGNTYKLPVSDFKFMY